MAEVQDILATYGVQYKQKHPITYQQEKVMNALVKCRTSDLGGHKTICEDCNYVKISYNSCNNRHCPKCKILSKIKWIENQKFNLLNVPYFHAVMTIPNDFHGIFLQNQSVCYKILFRAVALTLSELSADKKYLGAQIGFTSILHTWSQNLLFHPHIHCIIPSGGLNPLGKWVSSKKKYLLPVKVMSRKFRGKLLALLKESFYNGDLEFHGQIKYLEIPQEFERFLTPNYKKEWIVYCKPTFKTPSSVIEYLGRYTHRVAISNDRILHIKDGNVTFKWRDYKDNSQWKLMTITADEFIRRFLLHILPNGFMKIRHYGLLGNRNRAEKLKICKLLTNTTLLEKVKISTQELIEKIFGSQIFRCPCCNSDELSRYRFGIP